MIRAGRQWYMSREYPKPWKTSHFHLATYYSSQAMAQVGGDAWNQVFPQMANILLQEQSADGAWQRLHGSERAFGPTYSTSLAILSLTPAYQLLPIYQR